VTALNKYF